MSERNGYFVNWEEQIICRDKGRRLIHFYLKDEYGNSVLAVIGTERSIRHMCYVVPNVFLRVYGRKESIKKFKWRARREVVVWLQSLVSKHRQLLFNASKLKPNDSKQTLESPEISIDADHTHSPDQLVQRRLKFRSSDTKWSGVAWSCAKQLKHYSTFCRNAIVITVHSFVHIMDEEESHYLGYIEEMYENKNGKKRVKVRRFLHCQEVKGVIPKLNPHPREVFITPRVHVISAECIDGPATVLTPKHYEKCLAASPCSSFSGVFMCSKLLEYDKLKPFALAKLRGYFNQTILSCLDGHMPSNEKKYPKYLGEDEEYFTQDDPLRSAGKRSRSCNTYLGLENENPDQQASVLVEQVTNGRHVYPKLKLILSRKTIGVKFIAPQPQVDLPFKVDDKIELLCQDSGIRGCWFRCKILSISKKMLKVQYEDVEDVEGQGKLEEWVPASRGVAPDKLGTRSSGRLTIRPFPPEDSTHSSSSEIGTAVDAWWSDGWWEGVLTGINVSGMDTLQVYSPGEDKLLIVKRKDVRTSRDWDGNRWVNVTIKTDILAQLPSCVGFSTEQSTPAAGNGSTSCGSAVSDDRTAIAEAAEYDEAELYDVHVSYDLESMKGFKFRNRLPIIEEDKDTDGNSLSTLT